MQSDQVREQKRRQTTRYSLYGASGVAVAVVTFWLLARPETQTAAAQRHLQEVVVTWQCANGHRFEREGSYVAIPCTSCDQKANVAVIYECPRDGRVEALVRYERTADGGGRLSAASFRPGVWTGVEREVRCPVCGVRLRPWRELSAERWDAGSPEPGSGRASGTVGGATQREPGR